MFKNINYDTHDTFFYEILCQCLEILFWRYRIALLPDFGLLFTVIDNYILPDLSDVSRESNETYIFYLNLKMFINNLIIYYYINNEHNLCLKPKINIKEEDIYYYFMNGYNIGNLSK